MIKYSRNFNHAVSRISLLSFFYCGLIFINNRDEEEDFSKGINSFITSVTDRRKLRKSCQGPVTKDMIGIENRIIGCATFEKKYV